MASDTLNPYASPTVPTEPGPDYEHRTLFASFEVDELVQRDAARGYRPRHVFMLVATLLAIPLAVGATFFLVQLQSLQGWATAVIYGFIVGSVAAVGLHVAIDWSIFYHNQRQLRRHPILGAMGPWRLRIDEERIFIATSRGQQEWQLADVRRIDFGGRPIVLWLERDLAIALPKHGDYFEDDYAAVCKTLYRRITHVFGL